MESNRAIIGVSLSLSSASEADREPEVRERIFGSALKHFSQKGFAATSLREISQDAQTTKPMIYYYFGSKEGLYGSIVREILEEMADAIRTRFPSDASPRDQAMAFCGRYMDHFLAKEEIIALVLREVFGLGGAPMAAFARTLGEDVRQPLDEILERGMSCGAFQRDDVADVRDGDHRASSTCSSSRTSSAAPRSTARRLGSGRPLHDGPFHARIAVLGATAGFATTCRLMGQGSSLWLRHRSSITTRS